MTSPHAFFIPSRSQAASAATSAEFALMLLGPSAAMSQLWGQIRRLAPHVRTVLLAGEPDCGQEAIARLLLDLSPHPQREFMLLTSADADLRLLRPSGFNALPPELFLFLPDVHRLSSAAQDSLLRLMRLRRTRALTVVAATSEDLRALVGVGRFSVELADALGSVRLAVPSLKQRAEDLPMLISQMLALRSQRTGEHSPQVTESFIRAAMQHTWPGNLRELSCAVASLQSAPGDANEVHAADLQRALAGVQILHKAEPAPIRMVPLDTVVREHICAVLRGCRGNKLRAAEVLGISRSTLYRMLDASPHIDPFAIAS